MGDINNSLAGPSCPKKAKWQHNRALTDEELAKYIEENLSDECESLFSSTGEDEYVPDSDASENSNIEVDEEYIADVLTHQGQESDVVGPVVWENDSTSMKSFPFTKCESLLQPIVGNDPIDYFLHILTDDILNEIIIQTNAYAVEILFRPETKENSRITTWKDITREEILVFFGLILHMGTIRLNRIQDYWKTDELFGLRIFAASMSRNRFLLILRALHFAKNPEVNEKTPADRLYKIRNIINLFNSRMSEIYYPGREISLDESMVLWRGRLIFRQYIPNKRHRYGIKLYMITTPTGIVLKCLVYTGMLDDSGGKGHAEKVVMKLLDGILDVGHSVFMDNYYNTYELVKRLAERKTHCTGTIRSNRKTLPKEVVEAKLKKGETLAKYADGVMIGKWRDKRFVMYISNEYKNDMVETQNRRNETKLKPMPIKQYNAYMAGIDKKDQMLSYYPCDRKTIRWPSKLFIHVLQLMVVNSHHIYNKYSGNKISLYDYRLSIIRSLLKPTVNLPAQMPAHNSANNEHILQLRNQTKGGKIMRKQCKNCYSKGKRKDTTYICTVCTGSPGYCLECAKITHKL